MFFEDKAVDSGKIRIVLFIRPKKIKELGKTKETICDWILEKLMIKNTECSHFGFADKHGDLVKMCLFIDPKYSTITPRGPHYAQSFLHEIITKLHKGLNGCIFSVRYPQFPLITGDDMEVAIPKLSTVSGSQGTSGKKRKLSE